jgi:PEP-CTERM motif
MRITKSLVPAVLMLAAASGPLRAEQIFDFSFTNTIGNVAGTVTGEIVLPFDGDGSGAASDVLIQSFPPGLSSVGMPPIDASRWTYQEVNEFTVYSGQVTGASEFYAYTSTSYPSSVIELTPTTSYLAYGAGPLSHGSNNEVYADATSFIPAPAPEPSSLMLLVAGLLVIGRRRVRSRRSLRHASKNEWAG